MKLIVFTQAPELIKLTGNYTYTEGEDETKGNYEKLYFKKQEIQDDFNRLIEFCECVIKENYAIIYLGI